MQEKRISEFIQKEKEKAKKGASAKTINKPSLQELENMMSRKITNSDGSVPESLRIPRYTKDNLITKDDRENNLKSVFRAIDSYLYLIVKKDRAQHQWQFPQGGYDRDKDGVHLRHTARRELAEECGKDMHLWWLGHSPVGWWAYPYPKEAQQHHNAPGAKIFFYKTAYSYGTPVPDQKEVVDYLWVTKSELKQYLEPNFYKYIQDVLF
jgi:large subunit ribosomal protein L46